MEKHTRLYYKMILVISEIEFRSKKNYDETKLTHLTKKVLNNVSHRNRYRPSQFEDKSINKRCKY